MADSDSDVGEAEYVAVISMATEPAALRPQLLAMRHRIAFSVGVPCQSARSSATQTGVDSVDTLAFCSLPNCEMCAGKMQSFQSSPHIRFRPPTLKVQLLLQFAHRVIEASTKAQTQEKMVSGLGLSEMLTDSIRSIISELVEWRKMNVKGLFLYAGCYLGDVHWTRFGELDWKATARMIAANRRIHPKDAFVICARNCLEPEVHTAWSRLSITIQTHMSTFSSPDEDPIVAYWVMCCRGLGNSSDLSLTCVYFSLKRARQDALEFFFPKALSESKRQSPAYLLDHSFHIAIEHRNPRAAYYIWSQGSREQHASMLSSASCCNTRGSFHAFECAVAAGYTDLVKFLWQRTSKAEHNGMLLAEHCNAFCQAAASGFLDIVQLLWSETSKTQQFVLLFEQGGRAFREAIAGGHLQILQLLWESAAPEYRRQLLDLNDGLALQEAISTGRLDCLQYLVQSMESSPMDYFLDRLLGRCLCRAVHVSDSRILPFLLDIPKDPNTLESLLLNAGVMEAGIRHGENTTDWTPAGLLLDRLSPVHQIQWRLRMPPLKTAEDRAEIQEDAKGTEGDKDDAESGFGAEED